LDRKHQTPRIANRWLTIAPQCTMATRLDLARFFDLPDRHPHRMIAASIVRYVGSGIIIAATL
jgi:hypothetical protein